MYSLLILKTHTEKIQYSLLLMKRYRSHTSSSDTHRHITSCSITAHYSYIEDREEVRGSGVEQKRGRWAKKPLTLHDSLPTPHSLLTTHYSLPTLHSSLLTTHYSQHTPHSSLRTPHSSLLTPHSLLLTSHSSLLTTYYPLLTTHYSLPTTYTPHCSLPLLTTHQLLIDVGVRGGGRVCAMSNRLVKWAVR